MIDLLIRDCANTDRTDTRFPWLRNFAPYAGHFWASGHAGFASGNNQESSSESMNFSSSLVLYGEATGNTEIRDLGEKKVTFSDGKQVLAKNGLTVKRD